MIATDNKEDDDNNGQDSVFSGRLGGVMVSALVPRSCSPGSSPSQEHCVVFLGKTLYSHGAPFHSGV